MLINKLILLLVTFEVIGCCSAYRILGIYSLPIKSHFIMINQLFKGLIEKGHNVDLINTFPLNENNTSYKQIMTLPDHSVLTSKTLRIDEFVVNFNSNYSLMGLLGNAICKNIGHPELLKLAENPPKDPPYDIIILHMMNYHCYMILAHRWNIPVVLVSTTAMYPWMHDMIGNPENIAFSPNNMKTVPEGNGFWARLVNAYIFYRLKFSYLHQTQYQSDLLKKYYGPDAPNIRELEQSVSLVLMNTYFPINGVKPLTTGVVEVGGLHIKNDGLELDVDLKKWLDDSKDGVVYFSLGSMFRIETFPDHVLDIILESLRKLTPVKVLMRIAKLEELTKKLPSNIHTLPWIPQEKVLNHPNVKAFITHGGLLGTQEAVFYGVPMICIPLLADQWTNAQNYVRLKVATVVDFRYMTQKEFDQAIDNILKTREYGENVKRLSKLFRDRPQSPLSTAIYWIEYVIRNGKNSLRSPAMDLKWWQISLLDIFFVTIIMPLVIFALFIIFFIRFIKRLISFKRSESKKRR
ncbi:UDP-glucuronosyltransferase 2B15-like [Trichogramma pretiosum]|uniref:UDP-glucuronosyltransferase 2B15-like n=1 Tax=Trichogramma pretiosum TaxID=7493 RepID=UPI0006C9A5F4|nr:UDP-glucuronosyltransferase 2B15-like [Trichogramma pretiosum]